MDSQLTVAQAVIPFGDLERMAQAFAKSGLFGIKNSDQAIALMLIAQAEGLHPAVAARDYHVIQGRPALKADAMLARFQAAGGKVNWDVYTDNEVRATFTHPAGGSACVSWTILQAKNAGLCSKEVWRQYPRAMLRARVISEGIRTVYPGVSVGVYTPEELAEFDSKPSTKDIESVPVHEPAVVQDQESERPGLMKRLAQSSWKKDDLKYFCGVAYGISASKDLSISQLRDFVLHVESGTFQDAINKYTDEKL